MAVGGAPLGEGPGRQSAGLEQAVASLPPDALASRIPAALGYYKYAVASPEGMEELQAMLDANTPPLGEVRAEFRGNYLVQAMDGENPGGPLAPETAAELAKEFDLTLLTLYYAQELREPLQTLSPPDLIVTQLPGSIGIANKLKPTEEMRVLKENHLVLWQWSDALARSALERVWETVTSEGRGEAGDPLSFADLPDDGNKELYMQKRWAQHAAVFAFAATLDA